MEELIQHIEDPETGRMEDYKILLNLISQHRKSRSVVLTEEGKRKAEQLEQQISAILDRHPL